MSRRPAERITVGDLAGQQRFLNAVAGCVESTTLPLHARPVLQNLAAGKFEKLSFLTGILRGLLDKPAEVTRRIRAGSIFMLPVYVWILVFVGHPSGRGAASKPLELRRCGSPWPLLSRYWPSLHWLNSWNSRSAVPPATPSSGWR